MAKAVWKHPFYAGVFHNFHTNQMVSRGNPRWAYLRAMLELVSFGFFSGCLVSISLGFIFFLLVEAGIEGGWKLALPIIFGVLIGDALLLVLALFYSQTLSQTLLEHAEILNATAGFMFLGMGVFQWFRPLKSSAGKDPRLGLISHSFVKAFAINLANPSNWTFWLVLYSAPALSQAGLQGQLTFGLAVLSGIVGSEFALAIAASVSGKGISDWMLRRLNQGVAMGLAAVGLYWLLFRI